MKDKRFLIILGVSLVFILLFCDIIEGTDEMLTVDSTVDQTASGENQIDVDAIFTGTQSNDGTADLQI